MRFRTISDVARDICAIALGDPEGTKLAVCARTLRNVLDELNVHINANIVTKRFEIADNFTLGMPNDTMDVLKVGALTDNGRLRIMGVDEGIKRDVPTTGCSCSSTESSDTETLCSACCFHNAAWGSSYGELYGYRPPTFPNGMFRYNKRDNRIEFSSGYDVSAGAEVVVEYRAALGGEEYNLIPAEIVNALTFRVSEILNMSSRPGVAQANYQAFARSYYAYKSAQNPYTDADLVAALRGESMSAPKF